MSDTKRNDKSRLGPTSTTFNCVNTPHARNISTVPSLSDTTIYSPVIVLLCLSFVTPDDRDR